jgi:hypothetical protein
VPLLAHATPDCPIFGVIVDVLQRFIDTKQVVA